MRYTLLYESGIEQVIRQEGTEEELDELQAVLYKAFKEGKGGVVTFDEDLGVRLIRTVDMNRFQMKIEKLDEQAEE